MDVLVVGGGSREHALAWKLRQSPHVGKLYIAPGNGGTDAVAESVPIGVFEFDKLTAFAKEKEIGLTVIGPDDPLAMGIVDAFKTKGLRVFGPSQSAARLEGSKAYAKELMREASIPTAEFEVFTKYEKALEYVRAKGAPIVIKASGLALGKGVYVCESLTEAKAALDDIMVKKIFKDAGDQVVIEEFLDGQEVSFHAISDGVIYKMFPTSQDHKPIGEGDTGKNTGGMGVIGPVPWVSEEVQKDIEARVVKPTLDTMLARGTPFTGLLYPGLKMSSKGPKVLEFNARFGQPETEIYMRLMKSDLFELFNACVEGTLATFNLEWHSGYAATVVMASGGYPDSSEKGVPITGIEEADQVPGVVVFHVGTAQSNGRYVTNGGRVLSVSGVGATLQEALDTAYAGVAKISFANMQFRRDIGEKALKNG